MNIGDLFYALRADGAQLSKDVKKEGDKAGKGLASSIGASFKKSWSGAEFGKGLVQGLGLAGGLGIAKLTTDAIGGITSALGDSAKAAMSDQESQNRLRASLEANIEAWGGNTDAIEDWIQARQRLGFDDEALRDSLTVLTGATHDVARAQEILGVAMDLARFKGVDLRTASEALIKVEGGHYRSLAQLGIKLKEGATQQEAMNAVQRVATGQAEAYADTVAGRLTVAQTKYNEAIESLGYTLLPAVAAAAEIASAALDGVAGTTRDNIQSIEADAARFVEQGKGTLQDVLALQERYQAAREAFRRSGGTISEEESLGRTAEVLQRFFARGGAAAAMADAAAQQRATIVREQEATAAGIRKAGVAGALMQQGRAIADAARTAAAEARAAAAKLPGAVAEGIRSRRQVVEDAWDLLLSTIKENKGVNEQAKTVGRLVSKTLVKALKSGDPLIRAQAQATKQVLIDRLGQLVPENGKLGKKAADELNKALKSKDPEIRNAAKRVKDSIENGIKPNTKAVGDKTTTAIVGALDDASGPVGSAAHALGRQIVAGMVAGIKGQPVPKAPKKGKSGSKSGNAHQQGGYASGGNPPVGVPYWVGERGRELRIDYAPGTIVPHAASERVAAAVAGGGGDNSINLNIGQATRDSASDIHRTMMRIQDQRRLQGTLGTPRGR